MGDNTETAHRMSAQPQPEKVGGFFRDRSPRVVAWGVFAAALLVAVGTAFILLGLGRDSRDAYRATTLFESLEAQAYRLSSLEWQAVAERQLGSEVTGEVEDAKTQIQDAQAELARLDLEEPEVSTVRQTDEALRSYIEAIDEELRLLEAGQVEEALEVDEERVDPSFEELREVLEEAGEHAHFNARLHGQFDDLTSVLALVLAAFLAGLLFQRFERAQRSAELLRTQNLEAQTARLKESNRELQDFVRVASHDLQEPLRKVRTFGDRLKTKYADALDERGRDYLERMDGAAARMQDLIDDLLALSRIASKARPFEAVDLSEVADEVVSDLETSIEEADGRVEVSNLPTVEADRMQMRQLMQNLIGNALKFHKENEPPVVRVQARLLSEERGEENGWRAHGGKMCRIEVEDDGIGFDEKYLEQIFTPFGRLHGRVDYEGTGMGLAICRRVVERHGGKITAESAPGRGAKFVVTLPVEQREANSE